METAFSKPVPFPSAIKSVDEIAIADINRDGNPDIVVGTYLSATIYILMGNGAGGFTLSHTEKLNYTRPQLVALTMADMNGDNIPDLVYEYAATPSSGSYNRVVVELGDGAGNFMTASGVRIAYNRGSLDNILVADFNRDGNPDVLLISGIAPSVLLRGTADGGLAGPQNVTVEMGSLSAAIIDLNGDGAPDIVNPSGTGLGVARVMNTGAH
jgi:hypothetical protein